MKICVYACLNDYFQLICMIVNNTTVIVEGSEAPAVAVELKAKCMFLDSHNLNGVITATSALIVRELGVPTHRYVFFSTYTVSSLLFRVFVACQNVRPDAISNTGASTCTINEVRR